MNGVNKNFVCIVVVINGAKCNGFNVYRDMQILKCINHSLSYIIILWADEKIMIGILGCVQMTILAFWAEQNVIYKQVLT